MDYDPVFDQDEIETRQARDILEIELTKVGNQYQIICCVV